MTSVMEIDLAADRSRQKWTIIIPGRHNQIEIAIKIENEARLWSSILKPHGTFWSYIFT
jgi:hypothetical protein